MKLTVLFVSILIILQANKACAQSGVRFEFGFQNNLLKEVIPRQSWNDTIRVESLRDEMYSPEVGVGYQYELSNRIITRGTVLYSDAFHSFLVSKYDPIDRRVNWRNPFDIRQRRITIPVVFQYRFRHLLFGGGIEPSIKLKVTSDVGGRRDTATLFPELVLVDEAIRRSFRPVTWSYTLLLTYQVIKGLNLNFQYSENISSGSLESIDFNGEEQNLNSAMRHLSFRIGYLLPLVK